MVAVAFAMVAVIAATIVELAADLTRLELGAVDVHVRLPSLDEGDDLRELFGRRGIDPVRSLNDDVDRRQRTSDPSRALVGRIVL